MLIRGKLLLAGLAAALALSTATGAASAGKLSVNAQRLRIGWTPITILTSTAFIRCNATLEQSFHSGTIHKTVGALGGFAYLAEWRVCSGGNVRIRFITLPWHVRYLSFTGTLPSITGLRYGLVNLGLEVETGGVTCSLTSTAARPAVFIANVGAGGEVRSVRADETARIPLEGEFLCLFAGEASLSGSGTATRAGTTMQDVNLRLI